MFPNTINPYWWMGNVIPLQNQVGIPRIDIGGIYALSTNAVQLSEDSTTVDYGINPTLYNRLPNVSIVLLTISDDIPDGGDDLPVTVVVPNSGASTVSSSTATSGTSTGTTKVNIVDSQGTNVTGSNMQGNTQRLAYINKCAGTIRFLEFTNA